MATEIVRDPVRTLFAPEGPGARSDDPRGVWSFGRLLSTLAGEEDPSRLTLRWLRLFELDNVRDVGRIEGRSLAHPPALRRWLERSGCTTDDACKLDFATAPFQLEAIVNRMALRNLDADGTIRDAGQGRFVFDHRSTSSLAPRAYRLRADPRGRKERRPLAGGVLSVRLIFSETRRPTSARTSAPSRRRWRRAPRDRACWGGCCTCRPAA